MKSFASTSRSAISLRSRLMGTISSLRCAAPCCMAAISLGRPSVCVCTSCEPPLFSGGTGVGLGSRHARGSGRFGSLRSRRRRNGTHGRRSRRRSRWRRRRRRRNGRRRGAVWAAAAVGGGLPEQPPSRPGAESSIYPITVPMATTSPVPCKIFVTVPAIGEGRSTVALSLSISTRFSSLPIDWPSRRNHWPICTS